MSVAHTGAYTTREILQLYSLQPRDLEVFAYIVEFRKMGLSPSFREIKEHFNLISTEQVSRSVRRLKRGYLLDNNPKLDFLSRALLPTDFGENILSEITDFEPWREEN
jgi:SOS-response transcriptional repressor LexA